MLLWSEKHLGSFRKNNDLSKNVIVNELTYIRPKKELFGSYMAFIDIASFGGKGKEKEKKGPCTWSGISSIKQSSKVVAYNPRNKQHSQVPLMSFLMALICKREG